MTSLKKQRKLKNAYLYWSGLKNKKDRIKGLLFFTPSQRKYERTEGFKNEEKNSLDDYNYDHGVYDY